MQESSHSAKTAANPPSGESKRQDAFTHDANDGGELAPGESFQTVKRTGTLGMSLVFVLIVGVMLALFFAGWTPFKQRQSDLKAEAALNAEAPPRVAVIKPKRAKLEGEIILPGEIQPARETVVYARTTGYIRKWNADMGDSVKAGQILAEIDSPEAAINLQRGQATMDQVRASEEQAKALLDQSIAVAKQSEAAVEQAEAQLANAQGSADLADTTMKRYVAMRDKGGVTEQDISDKEMAAKVAHTVIDADKAAIALARAGVTAAKAAVVSNQAAVNAAHANTVAAATDVHRFEVLQSFEKVKAPFEGIITSRMTEVGSLITAGSGAGAQPLFRLACTDPVRVWLDVPQMYARAIKTGQKAQIILRDSNETAPEGTVTRTSGAMDFNSRTLRTEIQVPNPNGHLLPGMYAQVKIAVDRGTPPLLLPASTLVVNANGTQLALVRDGKIHFQRVVVESDNGPDFNITSGLNLDDSVVANPGERLEEGMTVTVVTAGP